MFRTIIAKRKEQRKKIKDAEDAEKARIDKEKKSMKAQKYTISLNQSKPVKFTFSSSGKILFKKQVNVEHLPNTLCSEEGIQIKSVSKLKNLSAIQRKKDEEAKRKAAAEAAALEAERSVMSNEQVQSFDKQQLSKSFADKQQVSIQIQSQQQ